MLSATDFSPRCSLTSTKDNRQSPNTMGATIKIDGRQKIRRHRTSADPDAPPPPPPALKYHNCRVSQQFWSGSPEKSVIILAFNDGRAASARQRNAIRHHSNGVSLADRRWPAYSSIWIQPLVIIQKQTKEKSRYSWTPL